MKLSAITTSALLASLANAHGYLSQPAATFKNGIDTAYNTRTTESVDPAFQGKKWDDSPEANTKMFTETFPNSQFKTLRALEDSVAPDCGNTVLTGTRVDVSSLSSMKWQNDQEYMGFIDSHHGPCEAWIDDTRVFQSDDCRASFTAYPAEIPIDFSSCSGDCTFTFYWLAVHEPQWQVYKQCAPISNANGQGAPSSSSAPSSTTATPSTDDASSNSTTNSVGTVVPGSSPTDGSNGSNAELIWTGGNLTW